MAQKNSTSQIKPNMYKNLKFLVIIAAVLLVVSGWAWWHYVRSNPKRVFEAMIVSNLESTGLTHKIVQESGPQRLDQTVQLLTNANLAHGLTTLSQEGDGAGKVVTETIGTPFVDYVRYVDIQTSQTDANGKQLNFSSIKNVWGKTGDVSSQTNGQLYNQTVLGIIPNVNVPAKQRKELVSAIWQSNVYNVDYSKVERKVVNHRPRYTYNVSVKADVYVAMLKQLGQDMGLTQLETVDPSNYTNSPPLKFKVTVDVWSRQATQVVYSDDGRTENLSAYGVNSPVTLPKNTISIDELQSRVQSLQQ